MAKYNDVTAGQTEACINRMGGWDSFLRFISGQGKIVFDTILTLLGTITVSAQKKFIVRDHFKLDTSKNAVVKIGYILGNFTAWFNNLVEDEVTAGELKYHKLEQDAGAEQFFAELGDNSVVKLSQIFALMRMQPKGEDGVLLTNGYANLFKVRDANGEARVVGVGWRAGLGYWRVSANPLGVPILWAADNRVFSQQTL